MSATSTDTVSPRVLYSDQKISITPSQVKIDKESYPFYNIKKVSVECQDHSAEGWTSAGLFFLAIYFAYQYPKSRINFGFLADALNGALHHKPPFEAHAFQVPTSGLMFLASLALFMWVQSRPEWLVLEIGGARTRVLQESHSKRSYLTKLKAQIDKAIGA